MHQLFRWCHFRWTLSSWSSTSFSLNRTGRILRLSSCLYIVQVSVSGTGWDNYYILSTFMQFLVQFYRAITDIWNKVSLSSCIPEPLNSISTRLRYLYWGAKSGVASVTGALHCTMGVEVATPNNIDKSSTSSTIISWLKNLLGFQSYSPFKTNSSSILTPQKTPTLDMCLIVFLTNESVLSANLSRNLRYPPASKCVAYLIPVKMLKVGEVIPGDRQGIRKWAVRNSWSVKRKIGKRW